MSWNDLLAGGATATVPDSQPSAAPQPQQQSAPQPQQPFDAFGPGGLSPNGTSDQQPAPAQPEQPKGTSAWRAILQGAMAGLAGSAGAKSFGGGLAGGAAGEFAEQQRQTVNRQNQQQIDQRGQQIRFASQEAALRIAIASSDERRREALYEEHRRELDNQNSATLASYSKLGVQPILLTTDEHGDATAALNRAGEMYPKGIPPLQTLQVRDQIYVFDPAQIVKAQDEKARQLVNEALFNQTGKTQTISGMDWLNMPDALKAAKVDQAMSYNRLDPSHDMTPQNIDAAIARTQNEIALFKHNGSTSPDAAAVLAEKTRELNLYKSYRKQAADDAATAAGQKAEAVAKGAAKGTVEGQMAAMGGHTSTGTVNPQTGADDGFLSGLPPSQQSQLRAIGEGRVELSARVMSSKDGRQLMQQLTTAYPNFDQSRAQSYFKTRLDFTSGKTSVGINSYNTAIAHLGTMFDHVSSANTFSINTPGTEVHRQLDLDKQLVSTELAKAVSNGQMTEKEKSDILDSISGATVNGYKERIQEAATLLGGKLDAYQNQWNNGAPPGAVKQVQIVGPAAKTALAKISGAPQQQQGTPVYVQGKLVGYTTDGKTMVSAQ